MFVVVSDAASLSGYSVLLSLAFHLMHNRTDKLLCKLWLVNFLLGMFYLKEQKVIVLTLYTSPVY